MTCRLDPPSTCGVRFSGDALFDRRTKMQDGDRLPRKEKSEVRPLVYGSICWTVRLLLSSIVLLFIVTRNLWLFLIDHAEPHSNMAYCYLCLALDAYEH